ncbi:DUF6612 family protein [Evansella tamaricis]|uniref:Uncharacterized protein n=1 Tax=Evansella tamaricis TaxID=2069301 RepID=A0ABS6JJD5_9BACI|nr:DUF6612 family protein [Evansella tamaricis]MBU9712565.1 hypothetical protein [Evansella tamaricis]
MRNVIVILSLFVLFLTACSNDMNIDSLESESSNGEREEDNKQEWEKTEDNGEIDDQDNETRSIGETEEMEQSGTENTADSSAAGILGKSRDAMSAVSSFQTDGKFTIDVILDGSHSQEEVTTTYQVVLLENPMMYSHTVVNDESLIADVKMYVAHETIYFFDEFEGVWYSIPMDHIDIEMSTLLNVLDSEKLDEYAVQDQVFEVLDNGDHFLLSFSGTDDEFLSVISGTTVIDADVEWQFDHFEDFEGSGTYEIIIDKETYYILEYRLDFQLISKSSAELGETRYQGTYNYSNYNSIDEIIIPNEALEQAQSMIDY